MGRQEYDQALHHQRQALQELRSRSKHQAAELESLRKLLADRAPSPGPSPCFGTYQSEENEEEILSPRPRPTLARRPSQTGRPVSQRQGARPKTGEQAWPDSPK